MSAEGLSRENLEGTRLVLARGRVRTSPLGCEVGDEAALLEAYEPHLRLLESRTKATVDTYLVHIRAFCRCLATEHPLVPLADVTKLHIRAWLLNEATRGIAPITRSNALFALRSFYRFLIAEDLTDENPAAPVTLPCPVKPRVEFYSDAEADTIIAWASTTRPALASGRDAPAHVQVHGLARERTRQPSRFGNRS